MALRNQAKNKVFSIINLFGLSIGLAVSILINSAGFEFSFDKMHLKKDRIYSIENQLSERNKMNDGLANNSFGYGSTMSKEMTGVDDFIRMGVQNAEQTISHKDERDRKNGGPLWNPCSNRSKLERKANGGPTWTRFFTWIDGAFLNENNGNILLK